MWVIWPRSGDAVPITYAVGKNVTGPPVIALRSGDNWHMVWEDRT